jgi:hypothetical protein
MNNRGFSLIQVVVGVAMTGFVVYTVMAIMEIQIQLDHRMAQRIEKAELANNLVRTVSDPSLCSCQLDRTLNLAQASALALNTSSPAIPDLQLSSWRLGCDFANPATVLATVGEVLPGSRSLRVDSIRLTEISRLVSANTFHGQLEIAVSGASQPNTTSIAPVRAHVTFSVDPSSPEASRRIASCLRPEAQPNQRTCPPGFRLIGDSTLPTSFCMQANRNPARFFGVARANCATHTAPGFAQPGRLCVQVELIRACLAGQITPNQWELVASSGSGGPVIVSMGAGCGSMGSMVGPAAYRCCLK